MIPRHGQAPCRSGYPPAPFPIAPRRSTQRCDPRPDLSGQGRGVGQRGAPRCATAEAQPKGQRHCTLDAQAATGWTQTRQRPVIRFEPVLATGLEAQQGSLPGWPDCRECSWGTVVAGLPIGGIDSAALQSEQVRERSTCCTVTVKPSPGQQSPGSAIALIMASASRWNPNQPVLGAEPAQKQPLPMLACDAARTKPCLPWR